MGEHTPSTMEVNGKSITLDWHGRYDERSLLYTANRRLNTTKSVRNRRWSREQGSVDQGSYQCRVCRQFGACTGYSGLFTALTTPRVMTRSSALSVHQAAHRIYHGAQFHDQWYGQFESYEGSSVLGTCQYLKKNGNLKEYVWSRTLQEVLICLSNYGPVIAGTDWEWDMFEPNAGGLIGVSGGLAGGHAYELIGINVDLQLVEIANSWGTGWGKNGSAWMTFADLDKLIRRRGEFALIRKPFSILKRQLVLS